MNKGYSNPTIDDLRFYFGEWVTNDEGLRQVVEDVRRESGIYDDLNFTGKMNEIRRFLIDIKKYDIPFTVQYRRQS